jgi:hypothetical protein
MMLGLVEMMQVVDFDLDLEPVEEAAGPVEVVALEDQVLLIRCLEIGRFF